MKTGPAVWAMDRAGEQSRMAINRREANSSRTRRRLPTGFWVGALLILALILRLAWLAYTGYVEEDAFITFRIARQLAGGNGFVYNLGERVDGTTTPLFTLLLTAWLKLDANIVLGARILDLAFELGTLLLVQQTLKYLGRSTAEQVGVLVLLAISSKLINMETQGMETPLVLFLMAAAWYAQARGRAVWAGVLTGLLLLTRMDLFLWPLVLAIATALTDWKAAVRLVLATACIFLPWVIFSTAYFGSPIPYTITAKWVAYIQFNHSPLINHFLKVVGYLTPFYVPFPDWRNALPVVLTLSVATAGAIQTRRERLLMILPAFVLLDVTRLVLTRATFANRYFIPALWMVLILAGLAAGRLWEYSRRKPTAEKAGMRAAILLALVAFVLLGFAQASDSRLTQTYLNQQALTAIGVWLHQHTSPGATVELEPLGYVGYYADRTMLDEVGLVTPAVVAMKLRRIPGDTYFSYLNPDFLVLHCDDALRMQGELGGLDTGLAAAYLRVEQFNPLNFNPPHPDAGAPLAALARISCYEIWQRK